MFSLNDLHKTQRGGVALRATFAALIALGSIPGAAAVSPDFSNVAFAATSDSSNQSSDIYIDALTTAADWKTISLYYVNYQNGRTSYSPVDISRVNSSDYRDGFLSKLKSKLRANQEKKEIPIITNSYEGDIGPALINPDKFYELYKKVTSNLSTYTKFSDASGFTESITSKPNNDTDVFLHDITEKLLKDTEDSEPKAFFDDMSPSLYVCKIDPQYDSPNTCPYFEDSANEEYGDFYHKYNNYWCYVLSGIQNKSWSFAYNTATGCMLPDRLLHEYQRLYDVDGKPKYLVQTAVEGYRHDDIAYYTTKQVIERFSYELPLHTIAKFVKDVTVSLPKTKALVNDQNKLTKAELQAIRDLYIPAFQEALKDDKTLDKDKIAGLLSRTIPEQRNKNVVISVPGIKTQVVPVKDITQTLDARKDEAKKTINALKNINPRAKKPYLLRVKKATTPEEIDSAEKDAQTADAASADAQTARAALRTKIKDATDMLKKDAYQYATPDLKTKLDTALSNAQVAVTDFGKTVVDLNGVNSALDDAMDNLDGEDKVFDVRKKQALDKLTDYGLSGEELKPYQDAINHAEGTDDINNVLVALSKKLLAQVIRTADELKTTEAVKYTQASKATKDPFDQQLDKATKLYDAPNAELLDLDTARSDLSKYMNALDGEAQVQLKNKKADAKERLGGLGLSKDDKKKFEDDIENAQSEDAVDKLLQDAKLTGVKTQAVQAVTNAAEQKKQDLKTNQGTSTDTEVKAAQDKVDGFVTTAKDDINKAKEEDVVNSKKDEAINNINNVVAENVAKAKLDAAKEAAKKTINDLKHLDGDEKTTYCNQVGSASDQKGIDEAVAAAKKADLDKVKDAAKKTIGELKNLEKKDRDDYCNKVQQASKEDDVNKVVEDAKAADLAKAKEKATKDIEKMNLTPDQQTAAKEAVNKAKDTDGVNQAVSDAKAAEAKNKLDAEKEKAKKTINDLKHLGEDEKTTYCDQVGSASDQKGIDEAVAAAKKADLDAAKKTAKETINALKNLEQKDKDGYCAQVDQATDQKGIDTVVEAAKLADAKAKALKDLDTLGLTPDKKEKAKKDIENATTPEQVTKAVNDAKGQGTTTDLDAAKKTAKETINALKNLEQKDKDGYCAQVDQATDQKGIDTVVEAAKAADLKKAKEKATNDIDNMNLTPEQKKDAKKAIEDANDPAGVTQAVSDAKDKEPKQPEHTYVFDAGYIAESEAANATTTLYRLYNPWTHEHLFTTDKAEYDTLVAAGWTGEGSAGMVAVKQGKGVYRLYNPYTGEHHYTTDENELAACVKAGWVNEGIQFYSVQNGNVPVYSMYNPYEKKFYHHYTSDPDEIARMVNDGWVKEGIKWYESK